MSALPGAATTTPGYRHRGLEELFRMARETPLSLDRDSFIFVRHGETDGNYSKIFQTADQPLNARGLEQARKAAECLLGQRLEKIVASTMRRAWHTAEIIGAPHKLTPRPMDGLRERWFGDLVGTPSGDHDWRDSPPNGETLAYFVERTQRGLREALAPREPTALSHMAAHSTCWPPASAWSLTTTTMPMPRRSWSRAPASGWRATRLAASTGSGDNIS